MASKSFKLIKKDIKTETDIKCQLTFCMTEVFFFIMLTQVGTWKKRAFVASVHESNAITILHIVGSKIAYVLNGSRSNVGCKDEDTCYVG